MKATISMRSTALAVMIMALAGCAATQTAIGKRELDVQTRMSDTVFLDPVRPSERTVFVEVRNTSDKPALDVETPIRNAIEARGYRVVDDPQAAHYWLQANVLQAGRASETAAESAYDSGFGAPLIGAAVGGATGFGLGKAGGNDVLLTLGGALAGAAIEGVSGAYVQDVTYTIITDLQVSSRADPDVYVSESETGELSQGTSTTIRQTSSSTSERKRYQTRVLSTANRANLEWEQASVPLVDGLTRSVSGIF